MLIRNKPNPGHTGAHAILWRRGGEAVAGFPRNSRWNSAYMRCINIVFIKACLKPQRRINGRYTTCRIRPSSARVKSRCHRRRRRRVSLFLIVTRAGASFEQIPTDECLTKESNDAFSELLELIISRRFSFALLRHASPDQLR